MADKQGIVSRSKDNEEQQKTCGDKQKAVDKSAEVVSYETNYKEIFDSADGESILRLAKGMPVHPMCVAVSVGHLIAIHKMVNAGANINQSLTNTIGCTALHVAVQQGRVDVIDYLLTLGADMCTQNQDGDTPFMLAVFANRKQCIKHLWRHKPRKHLNIRNKNGCNALHIAVSVGVEALVTILLESEELDINSADNDGNTALISAVLKPNMVKVLLEKDIDILRENKEMVTALCMSVKNNRGETTALLIDKMPLAERRNYVNRRIELLKIVPPSSENGNFFKTYLFCVITYMWRNDKMRPHMDPASFIDPWLEKILAFHKAPDGLCIHVPLASLALCMLDGPDHAVHRPAVDAFMQLSGHNITLQLMPKYSNNPGVLSGLVLLLVPLAHLKNGVKWLEKNYMTLTNAYEAFNKELDFHIPDLDSLPAGLGESLDTFTRTLEKIQEERSEQACRELLEEESKEKSKKQKQKKKDQSEKAKPSSSNNSTSTPTKTHNTANKSEQEENAKKNETSKSQFPPAEAEEFVQVITKKQQKKNRKQRKNSKSKDTSLTDPTAECNPCHSEKSTPSPSQAGRSRTGDCCNTSISSSPSTDGGAASLSEGERAITKLVSAGELSFVHPDVKHRSKSREPTPSKNRSAFKGKLQFLGDALPHVVKAEEPWAPKVEGHLKCLDQPEEKTEDVEWTPKVAQFMDEPVPHSTPSQSCWTPKSHMKFMKDPVISEPTPDKTSWVPKIDQLISTTTRDPKVEDIIQTAGGSEESTVKQWYSQLSLSANAPVDSKQETISNTAPSTTVSPPLEKSDYGYSEQDKSIAEECVELQEPVSMSRSVVHKLATSVKEEVTHYNKWLTALSDKQFFNDSDDDVMDNSDQCPYTPDQELHVWTSEQDDIELDIAGLQLDEREPTDVSHEQSTADQIPASLEGNHLIYKPTVQLPTAETTYCEPVCEQKGMTNHYTNMYSSGQNFASGDIAMKVIPKVDIGQNIPLNEFGTEPTLSNDHPQTQFHVEPEQPVYVRDPWEEESNGYCHLIDHEHLERVAQMPLAGEEFARLTPDPDPWYDNDTSFQPLKPSQLEPSLDTFTQLLLQQRTMAPSGEMMYGYDLNWKPKQSVHQTRKQDPWKQNLPYQRGKTSSASSCSDEIAPGRRRGDVIPATAMPPVTSSQAARGDSVRVGAQVADPYTQVNEHSCRTLLNCNGDEATVDRTRNRNEEPPPLDISPTRNQKRPIAHSQQNIAVIWGNRKDQEHTRTRKTYSQILAQTNDGSSGPAPSQNDQVEVQSQQHSQPDAPANSRKIKRDYTGNSHHSEAPATNVGNTTNTVPLVQRRTLKSPNSCQSNYVSETHGACGPKTSSPIPKASPTNSVSGLETNAGKAQKAAPADVLPAAHADNRNAMPEAKGKDTTANKNKKPECIVKVAAWSKWKPACDAFMKTQWMFKYRIDQIAVAKHPEHYIVGRGPNESIVMMGQMLNGSEVAVKRIPVELALSRQTNLHRLLEANISHKNVVPFLHFEMDPEHGFVVTELCEFNLRQHVFNLTSRGHMGPETGLHLCRELVQALDYLHARGIIHGKLKPENVLIDMLGRIRMADYGIAITANGSPMKFDTSVSHWQTGEQIGYKADVQTCGMLMYFILSGGDHPYGNNEEEILANLAKNRPKTLQRTMDESDDLLKMLILYPQALRPSTKKILRHPYFLDSSKRQELILAVWNELCQKRVETYAHLYTDLSRDDLYPQARGWMAHIKDGVLHKVLEEVIVLRQGQVFSDNLLGLLEFIDNVTVCAQSFLSPGLQKELGDPAPRFSGLFPSLPLYLYRLVRAIIMRININFLDHYL